MVALPLFSTSQLFSLLLVLQFAPRVLEDIIRQVSDCLRETLNEGDESIGLPSCNPLQLEDDTLNFDLLGIEEYIR